MQLLGAEAKVEGDIPGVADARLAGWRVSQKENTADENESGSSETHDTDNGKPSEPKCGDVVEVNHGYNIIDSSATCGLAVRLFVLFYFL